MVNIRDAIEHGYWCEGYSLYPEIKFQIKILSFEGFKLTDIDNHEEVHYSLNPNNGLFYLLKTHVMNGNYSAISFSDIRNCIYLVDQEGFRYSPIKDEHLTRYSRFAELHEIDRGWNNLYIPGISRVVSVAFFLPPYEGQHYSITTNKSIIQKTSSDKRIYTRNEQDGSINIDYAIESRNWFQSTPETNKICSNSRKFDIRIICFQIFESNEIEYEKVDPQFHQNSGNFYVLEFEIVTFEKKTLWLWEIYTDIIIKNEAGQQFNRVFDEHIYSVAGDKYKALNFFNKNTRFVPKIKGRGAFLYFLPKDNCEYSVTNNCDNLIER